MVKMAEGFLNEIRPKTRDETLFIDRPRSFSMNSKVKLNLWRCVRFRLCSTCPIDEKNRKNIRNEFLLLFFLGDGSKSFGSTSLRNG